MTIEPDIDERWAGQLRMLGLDLDDAEAIERAGAAADRLAERLRETLIARRAAIVDLIDPEAWRYLLHQQAASVRRGMLSQLGLPSASRKLGQRLTEDFTFRLRRGVHADKGAGFDAAHDLTQPVREVMLSCASQGLTFPDTGPLDVPVRACAVALCPKYQQFFLPVVLTWMRLLDPDSFQLLLPEPDDQNVLAGFIDELGIDLVERLKLMSAQMSQGEQPNREEPTTRPDTVARRAVPQQMPSQLSANESIERDSSNGPSNLLAETSAEAATFEAEREADTAADVGVPATSPTVSPQGLADDAHRAMDTALANCRLTLTRLEQGQPPTDEAIAALASAHYSLVDVAAALSAQLAEPVDATLAAIDAAASLLTRSAGDAGTVRQLLGAQAPNNAASALTEVRTLAKALLDSWPPSSKQEHSDAALLISLAELARAATAEPVDDADVDARYEQLRASAPATMVALLNAAVRGRVHLAASDGRVDDRIAEPAAAHVADTRPASPQRRTPRTKVTAPKVSPLTHSATPPADLSPVEPVQRDVTPAPQDAPNPTVPSVIEPAPTPKSSSSASMPQVVLAQPNSNDRLATDPALTTPESPYASPAPATQQPKTPETDSASASVDDGIVVIKAATWLAGGHLALAYHLLESRKPGLAAATRLAALADAATGPSGPHELELNVHATASDPDLLVDGDAARLLTTGAMLLATAVTGSAALGNLLVELADRMDEPAAELARPLGEAARTGLLAGRGLTALTRLSADDLPIMQAAEQVRERLTSPTYRSSRLPRASQVLGRLRNRSEQAGPPSTLGDALAAAADNQRQHLDEIASLLSKLTKPAALDKLIEDDDRTYRAATSKPIDGHVRHEMLATLKDDVAAVARWLAACSQHGASVRTDYVNSQLTNLRQTLLSGHKPLLSLLSKRFNDDDPLVAACAQTAHRQLARVVNLLSGTARIGGVEPDVDITLDFPLLAVPTASWDIVTGLSLPSELAGDGLVRALLDVPDTGLDVLAAVHAHATLDDFGSAKLLLGRLPEPQRSAEQERLSDARTIRVDELRSQLRAVQQRLSRARVADPDTDTAAVGTPIALDAATEEQLSQRLGRALSSLDDNNVDLRPLTATAREVQEAIDGLQEANAQRLAEELEKLLATGTHLASDDVARVRRRIEEGLLDLAADDISHLSSGEPLFDTVEDKELATFFPAGISALAAGIDADALAAVRDGRQHPALPSSPLPETVRAEVHAGLAGWRGLRMAFQGGWKREYVPDNLLPALRLVGLDARYAAVDHLDGRSFAYARGRRFLEVNGAKVTGHALVPAFGSAAQGRYRLLLVWNNPTVEQLDQWRDDDRSHLPLIVCYFGTLSAGDRLELARRWSDSTRRSAIVLDDAVLTWVATRRGNFDMFMRLALPFTSTQPFVREKRPDVPPEMFYGRARERRELENPNGPSVVYGGRGLGKSALLRTIMTDADASPNNDLVVVWFEVDRIAGIDDDPSLLWGELADRLEANGVTAGPRAGRSNPRDRVAKAVKHWTSQPGKQLLILLDEAEGLFNGDAPRFAHVRRLYQLSADSDFSCKVVFSGLHSVQHYYQAGNIPFSPTGHLQIGPLAPQDAYRLLTRPLAALGYRLSEDDAQRILLHCNYQPYLIQLVAHKLLAQQLDARTAGKTQLTPPWTVSSAEVHSALADPQTRRDVRAALGLTLDIDQRTRVITSVLALHGYDSPPGARMADLELYNECRTAWPSGFEATTLVAFRELLNELAGLGILAEAADDSSGRTIRNETVLRALGSREDAVRHLREVSFAALPAQEARGQVRPGREDGLPRSPLTTAQLSQLFRKGNHVRLIIGTAATGIDEVSATLPEVAPKMVLVQSTSTTAAFKSALETGATDAQRLLVVSNLCERNVEACKKALTLALGDPSSGAGLPKDRAASRTVALLAGLGNVDWLVDLADRPEIEDIVMPLERYTEYTLPLRWRDEPGLASLADGPLARDTLDVTDGWPVLVEQLAAEIRGRLASRSERTPSAALEKMFALQSNEQWCREFLEMSGAILPAWPEMARLIEVLVEYDAPCTPMDVSVLATDKVRYLEQTVRLAQWFGLVTLTRTEELRLSDLVASCWRTAKMTAG